MNQLKKAKDLSFNALLFAISIFGARVVSFLLVPVYTFALSTEDYGNLDVVTTTVQLLMPMLTLSIQDSVLRFCLDKKNEALKILSVGLRIAAIASGVLGIGLIILFQLPFLHLDFRLSLYLYILFVLNAFTNILTMYLKAVNKVKLQVLCSILATITVGVLSVLLLLVFKMGILGYLIATVLSMSLSLMVMMIGGGIFKAIRSKVTWELTWEMCIFSLPLVTNAIAWWINSASDRYILTFFSGVAVNGVYAIAYKIPTILATMQNAFYNAWSISAVTEFDKDDKDGFIGNVYMSFSCLSLIVCSIVMGVNFLLAKLLYANDFFSAWHFVPPLLVGTVFNGLALFEGCIFTAVKKTKKIAVTTMIGALVNTILNFVIIPKYGALGAAMATMFGYITIWIIRTIQMRRLIDIKANWPILLISYPLIILQCMIAIGNGQFYYQMPIFVILIILYRKTAIRIVKMFLDTSTNEQSGV